MYQCGVLYVLYVLYIVKRIAKSTPVNRNVLGTIAVELTFLAHVEADFALMNSFFLKHVKMKGIFQEIMENFESMS
jgi:hypothetical protein